MTSHSAPRQLVLADRLYRLLLLTYPLDFRRAYAHEMAQTFRACCGETLRIGGTPGLFRLCGFTLYDLVTTACREHLYSLHLRLKRFLSPSPPDTLALAAPWCLQVAQHTDIGCTRRINEDNLLTVLPEDPHILQQKGALFVVADGMGGHSHGDRASELAVNTVRELYYQQEQENAGDALARAMRQANTRIYNENLARHTTPQNGMGTTCIAAVLQKQTLTVANVGDSRVYTIHANQIRQVSHDHSLVADMVRAGLLTPEQASRHEKRNVIYRSLGCNREVEVDVFEEEVSEGDTLLLCTDGLCGLVSDEEILHIIEAYPTEESVQQLIARARSAGGPDNITAIVVRVTAQA